MNTASTSHFDLMIQIFDNLRQEPRYSSWSRDTLYSNLDIIWGDLESRYKSQLGQVSPQTNIQQSWNTLNGNLYEKLIVDYLNPRLPEFIRVYDLKGRFYSMPLALKRSINQIFQVDVLRKCVNETYTVTIKVEIDLLVVNIRDSNVIANLSCKTRFRERVYQPIFTTSYYPDLKSIFITMDRDRGLKTCENPSDQRVLLESYMERVFVNSSHTSLGFCPMVRPFTELTEYIIELQQNDTGLRL